MIYTHFALVFIKHAVKVLIKKKYVNLMMNAYQLSNAKREMKDIDLIVKIN
jgi:hypothetical protein